MKIERKLLDRMTIEQFADKYGLVMEVHERSKIHTTDPNSRYYAHFSHAEVLENEAILCGTYGNGITEDDAIQDYTRQISEQVLIIDAYSDHRQRIHVPVLIEE